jgi:MFS family permease
LKKIIASYSKLEKPIVQMLLGEFYLQIINAVFFLFLNFYMTDEGYKDYDIAYFVSFRFLTVMIFSLPLGLYIKGRKLKPFFMVSAIAIPIVALLIIYAIAIHNDVLLILGFILWSFSFSLYQIPSLPFILLNSKKENHSEAIASYFLTWSIATFICGLLSYFLVLIAPNFFNDKALLILFVLIGSISIWHVNKIKTNEQVSAKTQIQNIKGDYDWKLIFRVTFPTLIIAVGAGFTIPFINLFFLNVHGMDSKSFSAIGSISYLLVAIGVLIVPEIKRRSNYYVAITLIQAISILFLFLMATTEYYKHLWYALPLAVFFFTFRQPLMNVAGPMTSELTMYYVGDRNREMVSALNAAIWSGSWFISSQIFGWLRSFGLSYVNVFLITASLYIIGVGWYYFLIKDFYRRKRAGLIIEKED